MEQIPHARQLPVAQATPARHPRPAPEFRREHLPGNTAAKDEDNACEARAIRDARPPTLWPWWGNWQERFDKIPQRIWKQRGGHACSRYLANEAEVREVLLRALIEAMASNLYDKAYIVLGGEGWTLRDFYVSGGLRKYLSGADRVEIVTLEGFVGRANQGRL